MQFKTGFLSLLFSASLVLSSPIQTCIDELEAFQPQVSDVNVNADATELDRPHANDFSSVRWIRCSTVTGLCTAAVKGDHGGIWHADFKWRSWGLQGSSNDLAGFDQNVETAGRQPTVLCVKLKTIICDPSRTFCGGQTAVRGLDITWPAFNTRMWGLPGNENSDGDDYEVGDSRLDDGDNDALRPIPIRANSPVCDPIKRVCVAQLRLTGTTMVWSINPTD